MQKYFISLEEFQSRHLINDIAFQVIHVLRGKIKDQFYVGVSEETFLVEITQILNKEVKFDVIKQMTGNFELPVFVALFQGYPKSDKIESIIKYGTQLGICEIHPIIMNRSLFKLDLKRTENKIERFNKIAKESAEQSFRNKVPMVYDVKKIKEVDFSSYTIKILCDENSAKKQEINEFKKLIHNASSMDRIAVVVGPEGGISEEEILFLKEKGFISVGLGPRILRTETVIYYILSAMSYERELKL